MNQSSPRVAGLPAPQLLDNDPSVLVIGGSPTDDRGIVRELGRSGVTVSRAADVAEGLRLLAEHPFAASIVDLADGRPALGAIRLLRAQRPDVMVVGLADTSETALAGEALTAGAELLPKPTDPHAIRLLVANACDRQPASTASSPAIDLVTPVFAQSPAMRLTMEVVRASAGSRQGTTIAGEPGTGRRLLAYAMHRLQHGDATRPFVEVDCGDVTPHELERRFFGESPERRVSDAASEIERVSTSSAIAQAQGGTLFLRNLDQAPNRIQARIARVFRDREVVVLGPTRAPVDLDVRLVASLDMPAEAHTGDGQVRTDLYDHLAHVRIEMPPLRRRREDLGLIAAYMLRECCSREAMPAKSFSRAALALLAALPWPGNATELGALIEVLVRSVPDSVLELEHVLERASLDGVATRVEVGMSLRDAKARFERECISAVLVRHHGRVGEAAKALGIQRTNLYRKVRQLKVAKSLLATRK